MKPEAQRIAIAEACGIVTKDQWGPLYRTQQGMVRDCPDYVNDLNAMHEAEEILNEKQEHIMNDTLWDLMLGRKYLWHATAAQRAEAFLRTIGRWRGAK